MKEIKVRAWDDESEHMAYSDKQEDYDFYLFQFGPDGILRCFAFFMEIETVEEPPHPSSREVTCLMLFTGLKDKTGKEIYKGDILKEKSVIFKVCFGEDTDMECWGWCILSILTQKTYPLSKYEAGKMEIIGNQFNNSELLQ